MMTLCTTVLHGRVCHRTSTPHKSGNKMKNGFAWFKPIVLQLQVHEDFHSTDLLYCIVIVLLLVVRPL